MTIEFNGTYGVNTTKFLQDGTGAVIRNGLDKQKEVISVTDFGGHG